MIQSLKTIKNRIRSTENTEKVTAAMEMVSVAKLNKSEKSLLAIRPFVLNLDSIIRNLIGSEPLSTHTFLEPKIQTDRICLCVITSDSGLCGVYNNEVIRKAESFINSYGREKTGLVCVGRKGFNYFKKNNFKVTNAYVGLNGRFSDKVCVEIMNDLTEPFISGKVSQVYICYTHFKTALVCEQKVEKFLNIECDSQNKTNYILEPNKDLILNEILPKFISMKLRLIILESFTAEHSSRTVAMKAATDNAKELLQGLILLRNKVRQANITQEILEIISSSEALKG
ncbi:MAG: ATP synthase F1 subunit gamma [Candidatus Omnitrophota bacterium]|jgi:F-type H+-transporting ATPase subunit gamma